MSAGSTRNQALGVMSGAWCQGLGLEIGLDAGVRRVEGDTTGASKLRK